MTDCREPNSKNDSRKDLQARMVLTRILLGSTLLFGGGVLVIWLWLEGDWTDKAHIGDALNILTSLFSALAFAAVALSLWYQHREVSATIDEMRDANDSSRENLERQALIAEAMRLQAEALSRPYVTIRLEIRWDTSYYLIVENTGRTAAYDLRLSTDQEAAYPGPSSDRGLLVNSTLFDRGTTTFAPGQRIQYWVAHGGAIRDQDPEFEKLPPSFSVTATYRFEGRVDPVSETTIIDLRSFQHSIVERKPIELSLKEMQKSMHLIEEHIKNTVRRS